MGVVRTLAQHRRGGGEIVSLVEAVFGLGEVARHVLAVDGTVGAGDRGLDVAQRGVDRLEGRRARRGWPGSGLDDLAGASGVGHAGETPESVADHRAGGIEVALGKGWFELARGAAGDETRSIRSRPQKWLDNRTPEELGFLELTPGTMNVDRRDTDG